MSVAEQQDHAESAAPRAPRTNLLLAATVEGGFGKLAVRIRNLSEGGAMIEGAALPRVDETLILRRGDLTVTAVVVWASGTRCGVRFDRGISVAHWAGGAAAAAIPAPNTAPASVAPRRDGAAPAEATGLDHRLAEEIGYVVRLLGAVEDTLADEPLLVRRHAAALQNFDLAAQILGHLATVLSADDRNAAIEAIGMTELRARLRRKANF